MEPYNPLEFGVAALKANRIDEALAALQTALERAPDDAEALSLYGLALVRAKRFSDACPLLLRAVEKEPGQAGFRLNLAEYYEQTGKFELAAAELRTVVSRNPTIRHAWAKLTGVLTSSRNWARLQAVGEAWIRAEPDSFAATQALSRAKLERGDLIGARDVFQSRVQNGPRTPDVLCAYANACLSAGDFDAAMAALEEAEQLDGDSPDLLAAKGRLLTYLGRLQEAETYCRRCLSRDPKYVPAFTFLSQLTGGRLSDAEVETLSQLVEGDEVGLDLRIPAAFALARARDAEGDVDAAFAAYERANALAVERSRIEGISYEPMRSEARTQLIMSRFAAVEPERMTQKRPTPIFILGMPRSGTTLIEAVVAAHSQVCGKGELPTMSNLLQMYLSAGDLSQADLENFARRYIDTASPVNGAPFFTDKLPTNFEAVGLIARLFPSSPIVHIRRNPVETGFSIFRQGLMKFLTFANRLQDIGHAYGQYARLIAHWRHLFGSRLITIQYESFVADFSTAAPELLRACGLEWEERCRNFQLAPRAISTFSTVQVRGALSVRNGAEVRFARHLKPLRDELERQRVDLQTGAWRGESDAL